MADVRSPGAARVGVDPPSAAAVDEAYGALDVATAIRWADWYARYALDGPLDGHHAGVKAHLTGAVTQLGATVGLLDAEVQRP